MKEQTILVSVPVIARKDGAKIRWFIVKQSDENGWELPKVVVRKVESSVRAAIRSVSEQGGMRSQVYEEIGRHGGAGKVNGNAVSQRYIYYLMLYKGGSEEVLEFVQSEWVELNSAVRRISSKRDQNMLREASVLFKKLDKEGRFDKKDDEEEIEEFE